MTASEQALLALMTQLTAATADGDPLAGVTVERNTAVRVEVPPGGLLIVRDGIPGDPDMTLGGFRSAYYQHEICIDALVADALAATRDQKFAALMAGLGAALEADITLGGNVFGMLYGEPAPLSQAIEGGADIKGAEVKLRVEYASDSPLG